MKKELSGKQLKSFGGLLDIAKITKDVKRRQRRRFELHNFTINHKHWRNARHNKTVNI